MRSLPKGATGALMFVVAAFAGQGVAQPESDREPSARQRLGSLLEQAELAEQRLEEIQKEETANGLYSTALIDQLQALALLYQEIGEDDLAVESIERALQVERANFGLFTLDQVPLIEQLIDAQLARSDVAAARELEGRLLRLAYYHPDDLRSAEIFHEAGDRQLEMYRLHLEGRLPPEINMNVSFVGGPLRASVSPLGRMSVRRAQRYYSDAIGVILRIGSYDHEALSDLERKLLYTYHLELTQGDPSPGRTGAIAILGRRAHERLVAYQAFGDTEIEEVARAMVALADWELLFSHNGAALERYRQVYRMLAEIEGQEDLLEELFAPETPIVLPAFVENPLASGDAASEGYVDIEFEISRFGKGRGIDVVSKSGDAADDVARDLTRLIARSRFRPVLRDGEPMRASSVVRYRF